MHADTQAISIEADSRKVLQFLREPRNLPRWAVGFAHSIREEDGRWFVETGGGEVETRIEADERTGVVDFILYPAPGVEVLAASRVLLRGAGTEYVFTQFQAPGMPDEVFDKNVKALAHELTVLKAVLEVECPL